MRKLAFLLFIFLLVPSVRAQAGQQFTAVAFHDVVDFRGDLDDDAVTVNRIVGFFEWLRAHHWHPISLDDVADARSGKTALPDHAILITFDDGYRSIYTRVFPLILAYRIPIVVALVGKWIDAPMNATVQYGDRKVPRTRFLSWDEMREMSQCGLVEFASHSYDLHHGIRGNPQGSQLPAGSSRSYTSGAGYENDAEFRNRLTEDLKHSMDLLQSHLGHAPRTMVWPYGRYNGVGVEVIKELGFEFALTLVSEPADLAKPMAIARLHPTNDPELATLMSSLRFDDPLPSAQRFVALDPAALWTGDLAGTDARLGKALERLRTLGATAVVIEASVTVPDGGIAATWFPNRQLPMRADLLSRIAWQCQTRAGVEAYVHMSPGRAWATLGDSGKVRTLFRDLGTHVPISGIFMDDVPRLVRYGRLKPFSDTPWGIRDARNALDSNSLPPREALALEAFRAAAYVRPGLNLVIVSDDKADLRPSAIADLVLIRTRPSAYLATQIGKQMQANGFATIPFSRRVGLWFNSDEPPNARDLISATRSFQRLGGTVIGWAVDDPMRDLPNAKKVAPTVSAATFPVKF